MRNIGCNSNEKYPSISASKKIWSMFNIHLHIQERVKEGGKITAIAAMHAHNEEQSIAKVVPGCKKYVDKVVVVDDGSTDATAEIAEALGAHVVRHCNNCGYGAALRSCFKTARELGADRMVIIDSDGQHDPAEIPRLPEPHSGICCSDLLKFEKLTQEM